MKTALALTLLAGLGIPGVAQNKLAAASSGAPHPSAYQTALDRYTADRRTAATALFRLAECYRKQGKTVEAASAYARIVREFPDQTRLAEQSRSHWPEYAKPAAPDLAALRKQYRDALLKDVEIAEANLNYAHMEVQLGAIEEMDTYTVQRSLSEARGRLAAWDAGLLQAEPPFPLRN